MKQLTPEKLQSEVIDFLRFPLIIGILFIHNYASSISIPGMTVGDEITDLPIYYTLSTLFSEILSRVAVPMFFCISGFLFFLHIEKFDTTTYFSKLKSRISTLLIPYLFWNIVVLLLFYVILLTPALNSYLNTKPELNFIYAIKSLWIWSSEGNVPIAYQFWFVRDLMIVVILSPLIYFYIKKLKLVGIILLLGLWYSGLWYPIPGIRSSVSLCFFAIGGWFSLNKIHLTAGMTKIHFITLLYPVIVLIDLFTQEYPWNSYVYKTGILFGMFFWFNTVTFLMFHGKITVNKFLVQSAFFLFAFHEPLLIMLKKLLFVAFKPTGDIALTFFYFFIVLIVTVISLATYIVLKRLMPKFTSVITGGRN